MLIKKCLLALGLASLPLMVAMAAEPSTIELPAIEMPATAPAQLQFPMAPRFGVRHPEHLDKYDLARQAASGATIPLWTGHASTNGQNYSYTMVGNNPTVKESSPSTTVSTIVVPVKFVFQTSNGDIVLDPTAPDPDGCLPSGDTALSLTLNSPIFKNMSMSQVGTGQYTDLFQRANYFAYTKSGGLNPNYHVTLKPTVAPTVTITIANADNNVISQNCGDANGSSGLVDIDFLDSYLQSTVIPSLSNYINAQTFPLFVFYNVVEYENGDTSQCCVLGYHSAFTFKGLFQTYGIADFDSSQDFSNTNDISVMTHEVAEWMDDPNTNNPTPSWGNIGQVSGCQTNLEVGDPLSGTVGQVTLNGYTYTVQDLAFHNWFYRASPSGSLNGWYSFLGTFTTASAPC